MLTGAATLLLLAAITGEFLRVHVWSLAAAGSVLYLITVGSLVGFTAYAYVLSRLPASVVATYAYANPLVAVILGWALLGESLSGEDAVAASLIVLAVFAVVTSRRPSTRGVVTVRKST
jgi:drug/metabolite transporter (DMT)-like permease